MLVDIKVPVLAESVAEATLISWQKRVGDQVKRGDNLIDIETDKVTLEVAALNDGVISEILRDDGETVGSDEVIARIDTEAKADSTKPATPVAEPTQQSLPEMDTKATAASETDLPKLSPAVRNMVEEHSLDVTKIATNTDRVTKEDVLRHIEGSPVPSNESPDLQQVATEAPQAVAQVTPKAETISSPPLAVPVLTSSAGDRPEEKVPMTRLRKRVAERLLSAQHENAILTTFNEVNMQPVMDIRNRYKDEFEKTHGTKLGFMSFFTRAAIEALKKFPVVNASIDDDSIIYHGYFDIGIAVSSPRGLVVPIVRDADSLSLANIETQIRGFGEKARDGKLTMDDLTGGTFTITNGGTFGSLLSTPIINPPQSAILGMHAIQQRPVAENGEVVIRPMMNLALSYDHRIIDGREAVQFLVSIKQQLEDPARLLLQL
ncbi:MAG: dihydrolipoyllysine-residue succinyltransferase component of 2-oxoglutarate dehydrogenase complex [marine bacterium B5-7]|nr:MAG: dihydrolipoyllysine-residue succinyltransferase component of 2-oxoglutarate dehydrogenase complex [marine bacterium B5-7]